MTQTTPQRYEQFVFIHGVGLRADAWSAMRRNLASVPCLFLELPGHGQSTARPARSMDEIVNQLAPKIPDESLVIGHSIGALVTLEMLAMGTPAMNGAVLISPIYQRDDGAKAAVKARADALSRGENDPDATLDRWYGKRFAAERELTRDWLTQGGAGYAAAYRVFAEYEDLPRDELGKINEPVLVMTGADDPNSTPEMAKNLAREIPSATAQIVPDAAHMLTMTHPKQVAQIILDWTKGTHDVN